MPLDETDRARIKSYRDDLQRLGADGRLAFVDAARRNEDWPVPQDRYLAGHARKHWPGHTPAAYAQRAYDIKNRAGVYVLAYIHPVHGNRGLAFVDVEWDMVVQFDCEQHLNFDCLSPANGAKRWMAEQLARETHWRLKDTER